MYAKHGNLVDIDASGAKANTIHLDLNTFRDHSRSRISGSLNSPRVTVCYCIIMWALESQILKERSEHLCFQKPHYHLVSPV